MSIINENNVIQMAEQKIESGLLPHVREAYLKIVIAGMKVALNKGPNGGLASLAKNPDPIKAAADGAANIVVGLKHQAKGVMPMKAMVPAGLTIMLKGLAFIDKAGTVKIGNDEVAKATTIYTNHILQAMGITGSMLKHAVVGIHGIINDPAKLEAIKRKAGVVKAPDASEPTPMPEGDAAQ